MKWLHLAFSVDFQVFWIIAQKKKKEEKKKVNHFIVSQYQTALNQNKHNVNENINFIKFVDIVWIIPVPFFGGEF